MLIFVLEDMPARVSWLKDFLDDTHTVMWAKDCKTFLKLFDACEEKPDLVILDHDLGGIPEALETGSLDKDGLTGFDAVDQMPVVECPVLVWSFNSVRAPQMAKVLRMRGMKAQWFPFRSSDCTAAISRVVLAHAASSNKVVELMADAQPLPHGGLMVGRCSPDCPKLECDWKCK